MNAMSTDCKAGERGDRGWRISAVSVATGFLFLSLVTCRASGQTGPIDAELPVSSGGVPDEGTNDFADLSLEELMEVAVVVTAGRREQKLIDVPFAISVVTADDIRASGARSIPDALRLVPGVDVADLSFGVAAVSPRGFHGFLSNQVLVLVDGREIFDALFGGTLWGSWPFQLEDIDRIEVIRGPGGVTWGANAVNGVINIITKDPSEQLGLTLTSSGGSRGTIKQHFGFGLQEGKIRLRISGEYESSDGFAEGGSLLRKLEDDYKSGRLSLHLIYDRDDSNVLTFSAGSAVVDGGYPPTPLAGFGQTRNSGSQASYIMGTWEHRTTDDDTFKLTGFVNDFQVSPGLAQIDYRYQQLGFQATRTVVTDDGHTWTSGIDTRVDLLDVGNSDPSLLTKEFISTGIFGVYLQDEWRFAPGWTLSLGGRFDYELYGVLEPSARASLSYAISDESVVYGAVSRAFHSPTAAGRFLNIPLINGVARVTSNRDFDPTTLIAYELGYRGKLFDRLDTSLNLYWHDYDEVTTLSPQLGPPGLLQNRFDNQSGNVGSYGVELDLKYEASDSLTLLGNYTYQQLNWDVKKPFTDRDYITPPKHKAMIGARYTINDDIRLSSHAYYVDAVKAPNPANPFVPSKIAPYVRLDLNAEIDLWEDRATITVGAKNILDEGHYEGSTLFLNDAEVPRTVFAEIRLRF
jgi:iron complex outermembrane recepter protein